MGKFILEERPAFIRMVDNIEQPIFNGYTLQFDLETLSASIINLKKGGKTTMVKTIRVAKEGLEEFFELANKFKSEFDVDKEKAIQEAIADVEARFAVKAEQIEKLYIDSSDEIEVPDEEPDAEETEVAEEEVQPAVTETLY